MSTGTTEATEKKVENIIYVVKNHHDIERLIEAPSKAAALSYAVKTTLTIERASQKDIVRLMKENVEVESIEADSLQSGV